MSCHIQTIFFQESTITWGYTEITMTLPSPINGLQVQIRCAASPATVVITRGFTLGSPIPEVLGKIIRLKMSQLSWWQRIFPLKTNISPENWWLVQMINFLSILLIVQKSNTSWNVFETLQIMGVQLPTSTGFLAGFQGVFLENPLLDALAVDLKGFFAYLQKLCNKIPGV